MVNVRDVKFHRVMFLLLWIITVSNTHAATYDLSELEAEDKMALAYDPGTQLTVGIFRHKARNGIVSFKRSYGQLGRIDGPVSSGAGIFFGSEEKKFPDKLDGAIITRISPDAYVTNYKDFKISDIYYEGIVQSPVTIYYPREKRDQRLYIVKPTAGEIGELIIEDKPVKLQDGDIGDGTVQTDEGRLYNVLLLSSIGRQYCFFVDKQVNPEQKLRIYRTKYVCIDKTGNTVIDPNVYSSSFTFHEGLAHVEIDSKYGYIDKQGEIVIKPQFDSASEFYDGLATVTIGSKYGYINKQGEMVIKPQFDYASEFSEGLALVKINSKWGYINKQGEIVIKPQFDLAWDFFNGLALVKIDSKFGYIDKLGEIVIKPQYNSASDFSEGLACVKIGSKWGYINNQGEIIIKSQFDLAFDFSEGLARVEIDSKYGYINKQGEMIIDPQFESASDFSEGLAHMKIDSKYGYIDNQGEIVIKPQFDYDFRPDFSEGLKRVKIDSKYGYIDKQGKIAIKPQFDFALDFSEGIATVGIGIWSNVKPFVE